MDINIEQIVPNQINPNKMQKGMFSKLKSSILKFGLLNPIIVRQVKEGYEIIDGEQRWTACKELGYQTIKASVIEATDEEVGHLILATTIKGQHNNASAAEIIEKLVEENDPETLKACNLDKNKIQRRLKYHGSDKIRKVTGKVSSDEKDCLTVKPISMFKKIIFLWEAPKYCKIENGEVVLK